MLNGVVEQLAQNLLVKIFAEEAQEILFYSLEPFLLGWIDDGEGLGDEISLFQKEKSPLLI